MQQGICNPEFYGDLVYKFKKIIGNPNFSNLWKRIVNRFKRAGHPLDIMRQTACLVFNPIMVEGYAALLSYKRTPNIFTLVQKVKNSYVFFLYL